MSSSRGRTGRTRPPPPPEVLTLEVSVDQIQYKFDIEIKQDDDHTCYLSLAPRRVPHERRGCVVMCFNPTRGQSTVVDINAIAHDEKCSAKGTPPLEKKYGTRAMMLGAVHCMMFLASSRWPHLQSFSLTDESTFFCQPAFKKVKTFAPDLLLRDKTYYQRHLNMDIVKLEVRQTVDNIVKRMAEHVDMTGDEFMGEMLDETLLTPELVKWLKDNTQDIVACVEDHRDLKTWRMLLQTLSDKFGCMFFACCSSQLMNLFNMHRLMGAEYTVKFEDVPHAHTSSASSQQTGDTINVTFRSGGGGKKKVKVKACERERGRETIRAMRARLAAARKSALYDRYFHRDL